MLGKYASQYWPCSRRGWLAGWIGALAFSVPACGSGKDNNTARYGTKQRFAKGAPVVFADFELMYMGSRRVSSPVYPRGMVREDFQVQRGSQKITASWSSGTGDIGPMPFVFAGQKYEIEMSRSDKLGKLMEDELVIWKK